MRERIILFLLLGIDALILFAETAGLSISYREAEQLFSSTSLLHYIVTASVSLLGSNDFALRLPMIGMHLISVVLLYSISGRYLKYDRDRVWLAFIYMLLPGINSAALLVDNSGLVIMLLLLYVYLQERFHVSSYIVLACALFIDVSFAFLYLGILFYAIRENKRGLLLLSVLLFGLSMYIHGFDTGGHPKGHFLDTLGIYTVIFSPIVFLYLFYVLYRRFIVKQFDLVWYLATTALVFSLLLSFRQRIDVQMFAPYLILAMPLAAQSFFHSYRVRLKMFRKTYRMLFTVSFVILVLNALVVFFNKEIYRFIDPDQTHFAHRQHVAKELAFALREAGVECVETPDERMQLRLRFYGISECRENILSMNASDGALPVTIRYSGALIYQAYVSKLHK